MLGVAGVVARPRIVRQCDAERKIPGKKGLARGNGRHGKPVTLEHGRIQAKDRPNQRGYGRPPPDSASLLRRCHPVAAVWPHPQSRKFPTLTDSLKRVTNSYVDRAVPGGIRNWAPNVKRDAVDTGLPIDFA